MLAGRDLNDEAESLARRVVEGRLAALGGDDLKTLAAMEDLAMVLRRQARYDEAEALLRESLGDQGAGAGRGPPVDPQHGLQPRIGAGQKGVSSLPRNRSFRRTVESRRDRHGAEHPLYLMALGHLGSVLSRLERFEEAAVVGREQVEISRQVLGEDHPDTLMGENNLANTFRRWGRSEEAEAIYRAVLERQRRTLGDEHPETVRTISNLAKVTQDMGRYDESVILNQQVVDIRRRTLGENHPLHPQQPPQPRCGDDSERPLGRSRTGAARVFRKVS